MIRAKSLAIGFAARFFFLAALAFATAAAALEEKRVALVVGNGAYEHVSALPNPRNDAAAIEEKLGELEFRVITSLDAGMQEIRTKLDLFAKEAADADVALIFYAGHGLQMSGENYLLPVDAQIEKKADLATSALRTSDLYDAFLRASPKLAILIMDACRDNPLIEDLTVAPGLTSGSVSPRDFIKLPDSAGMIIAFAAAPGAVAYDGGDGNSPYTTALLRWIDRPGLELGSMFRKVRGTVLDLTRGAQIPWVEEALLREVYLNPMDPEMLENVVETARVEMALFERIKALDNPREQAAGVQFYERYVPEASVQLASVDRSFIPTGDQESLDESFVQQGLIWLSIRRSDDPEVFEAFLRQFPKGFFEELAEERIENLRDTEPEPVVAFLDTVKLVAPSVPGQPALQPTLDDTDVRPSTRWTPSDLTPAAATANGLQPVIKEPESPQEAEAALDFGEEERAAIQVLLAESGEYRGAIDADIGAGTRRAVRAFQTANKLPDTGFLDLETLREVVRRSARQVLLGELSESRRNAMHRVAAVAARGPGSEPQTLRVLAIRRNDDVHAFWREVADGFEASRPGYRVELTFEPGVEYRTRLMSKLGSTTPPDILYTWGGGHLDALRQAGFARDLTDVMIDDWALEFRPGALQNYTIDGRIYGAPVLMSLISLWVNEKVMAEAGVPLEKLATWEGFLEAVERLKAQRFTPIAIGGGDRWPFELYWANLAQQIGGRSAFQNAYAGLGEGFLDPVFVQAGREFRRLADLEPFQPGYLGIDDGMAVEMFSRGEAAMILTGNWRLQKMRWKWEGGTKRMQEELSRLPFPSVGGATAKNVTYGGVDGFAVNANAPKAAVDLLRVLTGRAVQARMIELASSLPSVSGADIAIENPFLRAVASELLQSSYHQLYYDQALGPVAGATLTEVSVAIATRKMTGLDAATELDAVWDKILLDSGAAPALVPAE